MKKRFLWGGFVGGRLDTVLVDDLWGRQRTVVRPAIFLTRGEAREKYRDVRKLEIREASE